MPTRQLLRAGPGFDGELPLPLPFVGRVIEGLLGAGAEERKEGVLLYERDSVRRRAAEVEEVREKMLVRQREQSMVARLAFFWAGCLCCSGLFVRVRGKTGCFQGPAYGVGLSSHRGLEGEIEDKKRSFFVDFSF